MQLEGSGMVPRLYFQIAGLSQIQGQWRFTTVMAVPPGKPLFNYLQTDKVTAVVFAKVEKAINWDCAS